jgi:hypothetical protein
VKSIITLGPGGRARADVHRAVRRQDSRILPRESSLQTAFAVDVGHLEHAGAKAQNFVFFFTLSKLSIEGLAVAKI